jgi:hypothetical protein
MKPLLRFTNVDRALLTRPDGGGSLVCNCLEVYRGDQCHCVQVFDLYASPGGAEIDPKLLAVFEVRGQHEAVTTHPDLTRADVPFVSVQIGPEFRVQLLPRPGEFVRMDRYFGKDIPADKRELVRECRNVQLSLTFVEREIDTYPENDTFRHHLEDLKHHLAQRVDQLEAALSTIPGV